MMFVQLYLLFIITGTTFGLLSLHWAARTRQFDEQDRARFLPLADLSADEFDAPTPRAGRCAKAATLAALVSGAASLVALLLLLWRHG